VVKKVFVLVLAMVKMPQLQVVDERPVTPGAGVD
jgi:hypothetical protein